MKVYVLTRAGVLRTLYAQVDDQGNVWWRANRRWATLLNRTQARQLARRERQETLAQVQVRQVAE